MPFPDNQNPNDAQAASFQQTKKRKEIFAAVPLRAASDERLTGTELRVLMVIAAHDRFRANGRGCDASRPRLATLARCSMATFSRAVTRLKLLGYINDEQHAEDGRRRIYSVVYNDDDGASFDPKKVQPDERKVTNSSPNSSKVGDELDTDSHEIGDHENASFVDFVEEIRPNIFPERENISHEMENIARPRRSSCDEWVRSLESWACQIEREWKEGKLNGYAAIKKLTPLLEMAGERTEAGHIERIIDDIDHALNL